MLSLLLSLVLALGAHTSQAQTQQPAAASAPQEDPAITALALKIYAQMRSGKVDPALLSDEMNKAFSPQTLAETQPLFDQLGDPTKLTLQSRTATAQATTYLYLATFATAQFHVSIIVDAAGKVAGYALAP